MKQIDKFWTWFQDNEQAIKNAFLLRINTEEVFVHLIRNLDYVSKRIGFIIKAPQNDGDKYLIIFTGEGYRKLFHKLIALEDQAPKLKYFHAQAFIKPMPNEEKIKLAVDEKINFENDEIQISKLKFATLDFNVTTKQLKLKIYIPQGSAIKTYKELHDDVKWILMEIIGEINYRKHVKYFELTDYSKDSNGLIDLTELQEYIDYLCKINGRNKPRTI